MYVSPLFPHIFFSLFSPGSRHTQHIRTQRIASVQAGLPGRLWCAHGFHTFSQQFGTRSMAPRTRWIASVQAGLESLAGFGVHMDFTFSQRVCWIGTCSMTPRTRWIASVQQGFKSLTGFEVQPLPQEETYVFTHVASGARFQVGECACEGGI